MKTAILEKSLASQHELEHRQQKIAEELSKGWEQAARYEELKQRLTAINHVLTQSGAEIETSPELSNLDEDAFRPVETGVSVHQILSLAEQSAETICEKHQIAASSISEVSATQIEQVAIQEEQEEIDSDQLDSRLIEDREPKSEFVFSAKPAKRKNRRTKTVRLNSISSDAPLIEPTEQMCFNWS